MKFPDKFTLENIQLVSDGAGGHEKTWLPVISFFGLLKSQKGTEKTLGKREDRKIDIVIYAKGDSVLDIKRDSKIFHESKSYNVLDTEDSPKGKSLIMIFCEEII